MAPRQDAEEFVSAVESMVRRQDDLIYHVDASINKSNIISPSTIGDLNVWVEVTLFNARDPADLFSPNGWAYLGKLGADIDTYSGSPPSVEIHKTIDGY